MRRAFGGSGAVLALALGLAMPPAVQGEEEIMPSLTGFRLQASNGYGFFALAEAPAVGDRGWIALFVARKNAAATYTARATVSGTKIDADLGKLGRISVTRVPTGRTKTVPRGCKPGETKRVKAERYEGAIEFHGEEGFTDVSATSAPLESRVYCGGGGGGERPAGASLPGARLDVEVRRLEKYRLEFDAIQRRPGARVGVSAEVEEHRGEMEIHRAAWTWATSGALSYDRRLRSARVMPPAPFAGHGSFSSDGGDIGQWTGNLTVDLPGNSDVPVTGPGFGASLEQAHR